MKKIFLMTILFLCVHAHANEPEWWRMYVIDHWLSEISVDVTMPKISDPNGPAPDMTDPNNIEMITLCIKMNLRTFQCESFKKVVMDEFRSRLHPANKDMKIEPLIVCN